MHEYLKSGRQALRLLYFLVISLALTKAITTLFTVGERFSLPTIENSLLFFIFLSFATRFFLGAYRVLSEDIDIEVRRPKITVDVIGFFIQALSFYVYSLNYYDLSLSQWMIIIICLVDLIWLAVLAYGYGIKSRTFREWMLHDIFFTLLAALNIFVWHSVGLLLVASIIALVADFWINVDFYFSRTLTGLRIFVAGPYGDDQPKKVIEKNVERARDLGKELALKGHFPFVPHTMLHGWETDARFTLEHFKAIDFKWLEYCDALFFIAPSAGADVEKEIATQKGLRIFTSLDQVPIVAKR